MEKIKKRFWAKVKVTDGCWEWQAFKNPSGYGTFNIDGGARLAHRVSFWLTYGRHPVACILHHCDNPGCVRPDHLFEGTIRDNNQDMRRKGRYQLCQPALFNAQEIREIRQKIQGRWGEISKIAKEYNTSVAVISNIKHRKAYKWVQ